MKETRRRRITVTSPLNKILTDHLGKRVGGRGKALLCLPPILSTVGFRGGTLLIPGAQVLLSFELTPREGRI